MAVKKISVWEQYNEMEEETGKVPEGSIFASDR